MHRSKILLVEQYKNDLGEICASIYIKHHGDLYKSGQSGLLAVSSKTCLRGCETVPRGD
jgi:hypothetical protein